MILKLEGKYYESDKESEQSQCIGCCFVKTNEHAVCDCRPYFYSNCVDENGPCIWHPICVKTAEEILAQAGTGD